MANLSENRLNETIRQEDVVIFNESVRAIDQLLPEGNLTDVERERLFAIDVQNLVFAEDAVMEIENAGDGIIPAFISPAFISNDLTIYKQLDTMEASLVRVLRNVSDLKRISGHEAYTAALAVYKIFEAANAGGVRNAKESYEKLKTRFENQGKRMPDTQL